MKCKATLTFVCHFCHKSSTITKSFYGDNKDSLLKDIAEWKATMGLKTIYCKKCLKMLE